MKDEEVGGLDMITTDEDRVLRGIHVNQHLWHWPRLAKACNQTRFIKQLLTV